MKKEYTYIIPIADNKYEISRKGNNYRGILFDFVKVLLNDTQLKKLKKGVKRFEIEWEEFYAVMYTIRYAYMQVTTYVVNEEKFYRVLSNCNEGGERKYSVDLDIVYDSKEDFVNKFKPIGLEGIFRSHPVKGNEIIEKSKNFNYYHERHYSSEESRIFAAKLLSYLPEVVKEEHLY